MTRPMIFYNSRHEIVRREIVLPSGKKIVISRELPEYQTDDPDEIEFLSKVFGLGAAKMNDEKFGAYLVSRYEDMPHVERKNLSAEDMEAYMASTAHEKLVVELLREKGYTIAKKTEDFTEKLPDVPKAPSATRKPKARKTIKK